jgi:hypothetical protein
MPQQQMRNLSDGLQPHDKHLPGGFLLITKHVEASSAGTKLPTDRVKHELLGLRIYLAGGKQAPAAPIKICAQGLTHSMQLPGIMH